MTTYVDGFVEEYYDVAKAALKIELGRAPTHEEVMEVVYALIKKHTGK